MTFAEEYAAFFAQGGKVETIPGFTETAPLPPATRPKAKKRKVHRKQGLLEADGGVTLLWIALGCGYKSRTSLSSNKAAMALVPHPNGAVGTHGQQLYNRAEAIKAVEKIKMFRETSGRAHRN